MSRCTACGAEFTCGMADRNDGAPCWCSNLPAVLPLPAGTGLEKSCYCPQCLQRRIDDSRRGDSK